MVADESGGSDYPVWGADRPRGILSSADREFLSLSPEEREQQYSRAAKGQRERAVRERTVNGILDFCLLFRKLTERDRGLIFNPHEIDNETELRHGMRDALALFYLETWKPKYGGESTDVIERFDSLLRNAVHSAEAEWRDIDPEDVFEEIVLSMTVVFNVLAPEPVNTDLIADKIARSAPYELTEEEARFYLFVQLRSGEKVKGGEDAAHEFLENVERLSEEGLIEGSSTVGKNS